jgi:hypothetical protein
VDDLKAVAQRYFEPSLASVGIITNRESVEGLGTDAIEIINL